MRLSGKAALVTGGAMGIGKAIASAFLREAAFVAFSDISSDASERTLGEMRDLGRVIFIPGDVAVEADVRRMVEATVAEFGRLDILVNNAGITLSATVAETREADWDRVLAVNLKSIYLCSKHAIPHLIASGGGSIINLGSIAGFVGLNANAAYNASKGGVILLTKNMALDYADKNIRVNAICPAMIMTPMLESFIRLQPDPEEYVRRVKQSTPLGRMGTAEEVAAAALFLASDESSYITGSALMVDGGYTAR
jgi:NAD(P)-dependent dehydrogenase (short-subunit alcohol dehydrogenase family)